ncbi:Uncharacterised protein [Nocardia otitidiscaviarum]|uniref:Uncharacterized protein n=1 Tax=Nocardia otitidiscaviarum TaxID=1823 RepID=A0A379JMF5_9NOCA|nr:hypothetical protein [Nocardia otitidiscaviarum]SUD49514.1 Uncharacterised protein [Nocardia otitidiscaviarum]SUD49610.1 Uncharacterised protein [Nocardia otitidiscaviarum]
MALVSITVVLMAMVGVFGGITLLGAGHRRAGRRILLLLPLSFLIHVIIRSAQGEWAAAAAGGAGLVVAAVAAWVVIPKLAVPH